MRVIVTSDTHYHPHWHTVLEDFVSELASLHPDCLVVAGDVGEGLNGFESMLDLLQIVDCPRLILAGNHDVWSEGIRTSELLWKELLPKAARNYGCIWLEDENWASDRIGICGTIGWYDYTGRDPSLPYTDDEYFMMKRLYMVDGNRVNWKWTDIEFSSMVGQNFSTRLKALNADPTIRDILVVTHVPTFAEAIIRDPGNISWNTSNAYFYNLTLGSRIQACAKVNRVISGHTHTGVSRQVYGGSIQFDVIPADYGHPAYVMIDY